MVLAISRKGKIALASMTVFVLIVLLVLYVYIGVPTGEVPYPRGPQLSSSDRVIVIAPHPDDESLGCAGVLRRAVEKQVPTLVVLMTNGDGYRRNVELLFHTSSPTPEDFRRLGNLRHLESLHAVEQLGLGGKDIIFLSYPDGGTNSLFDVNWDSDKLHLGVNGATHAPYSFAYEKQAPYCGENVVKNLKEIVTSFRPSVIFYPDPEDNHHDHWATSAFVEYVLSRTGYKGKQLTYLVHRGFDWPYPWRYAPARQLLPPPELLVLDAKWMEFFVSKNEEALKRRAVNLYQSQRDLMEPFVEAFVRRNELFAEYPDIRVVEVKKKPDFFSGDRLPHTVFRDPQRDTIIRELEGFGDLTAVGFALSKKDAWLALEAQRRIAGDLVYAFHLRIFHRDSVDRLDINVQYGKALSQALAKNSIGIGERIPAEVKGNRLVVLIPAKLFKDSDSVLLNADSFNHNQRRIDRTAWRRVLIAGRARRSK